MQSTALRLTDKQQPDKYKCDTKPKELRKLITWKTMQNMHSIIY